MRDDSLAAVRASIARAILGKSDLPRTLGSITLRAHQHAAATRLHAIVAAHGGAVLAEPVGIGKTYAALAVAASHGGRLLITAPSALRDMWREALAACGLEAEVVAHEALSRGTRPIADASFIIVDEAHRLRNPATRRYALLAELARRAKLLLVSATPVQNRRTDLAAQIALFAGRSAWELSEEGLAAYVVRGSSSGPLGQPRLDGPHLVTLPGGDDWLDQLLELPPPVPAQDESIAGALLTYGLLHQWTSSRAALVAALKRRRARGLALRDAIAAGRHPTRAELSAWSDGGDALQLAFPELVASSVLETESHGSLTAAIDRHVNAVHDLLMKLREFDDSDDERAAALRQIRARHPGERIIAFCHYAETVHALRAKLARDAGVAALTAAGARIASGRIRREDVLRQFSVREPGSLDVQPVERVDLLLTTDLLSEGLNLQEASVIVHLDLPWNPARLEQRVGRALRLGSRHPAVTVYTIAPPVAAERMLQIERRLRGKLSIANRTVGVAGRILPSIVATPEDASIAERAGELHRLLSAWVIADVDDGSTPTVAAVASPVSGFLAAIRDADGAHLVACLDGEIQTQSTAVARAARLCSGLEVVIAPLERANALRRLDGWLAARQGELGIDFHAAATARARREALARVARSLDRAPRHRRSVLAPLADAARAVATAPLAEGAERILETLVGAELPDEAWLRSIATFAELNARERRPRVSCPPAVISIILLQSAGHSL